MPASDEEAKAKLIEYKEKGEQGADAAADHLQAGVEDAREGLKDGIDAAQSFVKDLGEDAEETRQSAVERVEHYSDLADQRAGEYLQMVKASASNAQVAFDDGLGAASDAVKSGVAEARFQYSRAHSRSQEIWEISVAHTQAGLDTAFDTLKDGVKTVREHEKTAIAAGLAAALVLLPGPRRLLWRQTVGRLRSEEGIFKSAELKATHLQQDMTSHSAEATKLVERLAAAQTQYNAGLAKLMATNKQLQALQSQVSKTEQGAQSLIETLRELPSSHALKLRAGIALKLAAAKAQRASLDRQIYKLSKKGF